MTNTTVRRAERRRAHRNHWIVALSAVAAIALVVVVAIATRGSSTDTEIVRTGETNSMGMPVIDTPGTASGTAEVDGITATPRLWALGQVPLNIAVRPDWTFDNTGTQAVTLGEPHVQINEGCCPARSPTPDPPPSIRARPPGSPSSSPCTPAWTAPTTWSSTSRSTTPTAPTPLSTSPSPATSTN